MFQARSSTHRSCTWRRLNWPELESSYDTLSAEGCTARYDLATLIAIARAANAASYPQLREICRCFASPFDFGDLDAIHEELMFLLTETTVNEHWHLRRDLTARWSARVKDKVPTGYAVARGAQLGS